MEWLSDPSVWIAFATLTLLELVLGIDNIVFISILAGKLPPEQQSRARYIGLALALVMRVILLFSDRKFPGAIWFCSSAVYF